MSARHSHSKDPGDSWTQILRVECHRHTPELDHEGINMAELDLHFGAGLALGVGETARQARWME